MPAQDPTVVDDVENSRYAVLAGSQVAGAAEYRRTPSTIAFLHTVIDPRREGHGLGATLARTVLDAAREVRDAVLPFCPFIRGYIQRHPEYVDLVPAERRAAFQRTSPPDVEPDPVELNHPLANHHRSRG